MVDGESARRVGFWKDRFSGKLAPFLACLRFESIRIAVKTKIHRRHVSVSEEISCVLRRLDGNVCSSGFGR